MLANLVARDLAEVATTQLHHFADASQNGYGAATYLRVEDKNGRVKCLFVMGKSRLVPIKSVTIPCMELSAAVVAKKLDKISRQEISFPINQSFFWTDSTCVLRYIENKDKRFQTFVANRIAAIHNATCPFQWNYVNTELNPADDASRGVSADSLERWIQGPEFLRQSNETWPKRPAEMNASVDDADPEVKRSIVCANHGFDPDLMARITNRYSSWTRLRRVVAWMLRYKANLLRQRKKRKTGQTVDIKFSGSTNSLNKEERGLLSRVTENQKTSSKNANVVKKASNIYKLDPVFDEGLICVGGHLGEAPISKDSRHPVILPKVHHVVTLITNHYHNLSGHSGLEYTLSLIRQK